VVATDWRNHPFGFTHQTKRKMMNNKTSIFVSYALLVLVGFGGTALLGFTGKNNDTNAVVAFLGFYGFLCTTGAFYVLGKQKAALDSLVEHINEVNDSHYKNAESIHRRVDDGLAALERDTQKQVDSVWVNIDRLESDLENCRACTPCKK
jgi:hypothetical protein